MSRRAWLILLLLLGLGTGLVASAAAAAAAADRPSACSSVPCEGDPDHDGVYDGPNAENGPYPDNCPSVKNGDQINSDDDPDGDACDADDDNDGIADGSDNCRTTKNPDQADRDRDGIGDACAVDDDRDGLVNERDNCPGVANPDQADNEGDRVGDACDPDDDNDTIPDERDNCPKVDNRDQTDRDGDGIGTVCDSGESVDGGGSSTRPGTTPETRRDADSVAPSVTISLARRQRRADLEGGMPTSVRCSEACALTAELRVGARTARRLRLRSPVLARGTATLGAAGRTWVFVRMRPAARRKLFAGRARAVSARLSLRAVDSAGNRRSTNKALTLVR